MRSTPRLILTAIGVTAMLATAGCSWFNSRGNGYAQNPRPLEVPPDMVAAAPASSSGSVLASAQTATLQGFQVDGTRADVFAKIGGVLGAMPGVRIASSSAVLGLYDLVADGMPILLRVTEQNGQVMVTGVDPRGQGDSAIAIQKFLMDIRAKL